jgi:hypothetical protein
MGLAGGVPDITGTPLRPYLMPSTDLSRARQGPASQCWMSRNTWIDCWFLGLLAVHAGIWSE